ncbi:hypothetical protein BCR34DRAFT_539059 [Clohesyomyces aquaticus]|uniref:Peroxin/Ferlin domain-containing protein n=1 Tax=Clohesyomyces aquaticus TaxID=1231657 RepID=A0A1Y1ZKN4_9PLEO|nr:hypothetical protein BCR34DRAFT_539059 [Clohesyomyces aquaticus]
MAEQHITLVDHASDEPDSTAPAEEPPRTPDSHIDILYENQRGWFVFGIPLFSSKALWNLRIDQSPWVDANLKPSAVNITNAQVPDPSWVWEWKSWYVDMSHDVDEEGWQYSLWFRGAAWHGNHPWFHSFVRRRRWLRKRVKQRLPKKTKDNRERLFGETFSIGTTLARTTTAAMSSIEGSHREESVDEEIRDVPTLMNRLKKAAIDRERIVAVNRFIEEGGEELHYLAEQIPAIMAQLVFQNSRRQLLANLMRVFDSAKDHREEHKERGEAEDETEERRINNLLKAVEAAEAECKKLEYWSDIRRLAENGQAGGATDPTSGWDHKWEGLDASGPKHP